MKGTREFYELTEQFERDVRKFSSHGHRFDRVGRDEKVPASVFYNDGHVNELFHAYMHGYQFGKYQAAPDTARTDGGEGSHD